MHSQTTINVYFGQYDLQYASVHNKRLTSDGKNGTEHGHRTAH